MEKRKTQFIPKRTGFGITISVSLLLILFAIFSCRSSDADNKVTARWHCQCEDQYRRRSL